MRRAAEVLTTDTLVVAGTVAPSYAPLTKMALPCDIVPMKHSDVAIVGGGLAGLAAAVVLAERGYSVELFEARRRLGGRASSFRDPLSGELVDYCQHVSMGCCSNLNDFCRRLKIDRWFDRYERLNFVTPGGDVVVIGPGRLPAPFHLAPSLWRLPHLSRREKLRIAWVMLKLARRGNRDPAAGQTFSHWLSDHKQSLAAVSGFWEVVLVSALAETLDRISVAAARKVFVDGFLSSRSASAVLVPRLPLSDLYGDRIVDRLKEIGVRVHLESKAEDVATNPSVNDDSGAAMSLTSGGDVMHFRHVIVAVDWRAVSGVLAANLRKALPELPAEEALESSPITGVHLWFDRPLTELPHAVLIGRTSQWLFARSGQAARHESPADEYYYQVVISASRAIAALSQTEVTERVFDELREVFPHAEAARLLRARVVTERHAVFSPLPGSEAVRPAQATSVAGLYLAGDWTKTGWPSTMESAVRSGYLAAEAVLRADGSEHSRVLVADSRWGWLAKRILRI